MTAAVIHFRLSDRPGAGGTAIDPHGDGNSLMADLRQRFGDRLTAATVEQTEERAGILEFDAGMNRREAERAALAETENRPTEIPSNLQETSQMALTVHEPESSGFAPCPAGSFAARCVQIIDMGTQTTDFQGEPKTAPKILIGFEICDPDTLRDDGRPFVVSKRFTASLHEKASLRKSLESWRGRPFTADELRGFHLGNILGKPALVSITRTEKNERTYSNLSAVMGLPRGMQCPEQVNTLVSFDLAKPDWSVFDALHERLQ